MKYSHPMWERDLARDLEETLDSLPEAGAVTSHENVEPGYDYLMEFELGKQLVRLLVECKRAAYPRDVRELAGRWEKLAAAKNAMPMLAAESISLPLREELRQRKLGYYDRGGSLFLPLNAGGYIFVDRPPPPRAAGHADVFEGKALRIVHHLLTDAKEWHQVTEIARLCGLAASTASRTLAELERQGWLQARGAGPYKERVAAQPGSMLDAWVEALRTRPAPTFTRYFVPGASNWEGVIRRVALAFKNRGPYAVTHQAAAQIFRPWLTDVSLVKLRALAHEGARAALQELRAEQVDEGANLAVLEVSDALDIFREEARGGVNLATPVQVYVDLLQGGEGRSKEIAEKLRAEEIKF